MLYNHNRTLPSRNKLKRLTDYSEAIQKHVKTLAIHNKIAFYMILEKNGQVHPLHAGEIEHIYNADPQKARIITEHHHSGISPFQYCGWKQVWVDDEAMQNLLKNNPIIEASDLDSDKAFLYTERRKMLEAILGMAMHAYRYDPSSARNTATGNNKDSISAGIQSVGLNVSDDTMRSYLNEAKEIFPNVKPTKS